MGYFSEMCEINSHLSKCFWGAKSNVAFSENLKALIWGEFGALSDVFMGDNLVAIGRNLSFLSDDNFMRAFKETVTSDNLAGQGIIWRLYTFCWAAKSCLRRKGDFVECGVSTGTSSKIMCDYVDFGSQPKTLWLYDVFGADQRLDTSAYFGDQVSVLNEVRGRFSPYDNVKIVPGFIPDSFEQGSPAEIAFLHIDLNNADAEIATLDALFERVTPGGIILFDDYGATGYRPQKIAEDAWMEARGYSILEMPTGQGLVVKI